MIVTQNVDSVDFNGTPDRGLIPATQFVPQDQRYLFVLRSLCFVADGAVTSASLIYRTTPATADPALDDCLRRTWTFDPAGPFTIAFDCCCLNVPHTADVVFTTQGILAPTKARLTVDFDVHVPP